MKYFNLRSLSIFLVLNTVDLTLNSIWTSDKGWILFIASLFISFSILFWLIQSTISLIRKAKLKNELAASRPILATEDKHGNSEVQNATSLLPH